MSDLSPSDFADHFFGDNERNSAAFLTTFGVVFVDDGTTDEDMYIEAGFVASRREARALGSALDATRINERVTFLARRKKGHLLSGRFCVALRPGSARPRTEFRTAERTP